MASRRVKPSPWCSLAVPAFETHPVTPDRVDDVVEVANPNRRASQCWCLSHRLSAREVEVLGDGTAKRHSARSAAG